MDVPEQSSELESRFRYFQSLRERFLERARRVAADADRRLRNVMGTTAEDYLPDESGPAQP